MQARRSFSFKARHDLPHNLIPPLYIALTRLRFRNTDTALALKPISREQFSALRQRFHTADIAERDFRVCGNIGLGAEDDDVADEAAADVGGAGMVDVGGFEPDAV